MKLTGLGKIDFEKGGGLVPVVARDNVSGKVLMVAYANKEAVEMTARTGFAHYFSRSRGRLWKKGEESGHTQRVKDVRIDCDGDALLYEVDQTGPACHTGEETCFFNDLGETDRRAYDSAMVDATLGLLRAATLAKRKWVRDRSRKYYDYLVNPVTEGIPPPPPEILEWIAGLVDRAIGSSKFDKVVTFEASGVPYGLLLAQRRKKPLVTVRRRDFHAPESLFAKVRYSSGFERGAYFVYGLAKGERVVLVDDTVSTGGTLVPTLKALRERGVRIVDVVCVTEKPGYGGRSEVRRQTGIPVKTLFSFGFKDSRVEAEVTPTLSRLLRTRSHAL